MTHSLRDVAPSGIGIECVCCEPLVFLQPIAYAKRASSGKSCCRYHAQTGITYSDRQWHLVQTGSSHYQLPGSSPPTAVLAHVLVNPVVGAAHKQVRLSLIDGGCRSSRSQAIAWDLTPASPCSSFSRLLESATCICLSGRHGECAPKYKE